MGVGYAARERSAPEGGRREGTGRRSASATAGGRQGGGLGRSLAPPVLFDGLHAVARASPRAPSGFPPATPRDTTTGMIFPQSRPAPGRGVRPALAGLLATCLLAGVARSADPVFSGPQPGEKTTGFEVLDLTGGKPGDTSRDPVAEADGKPTALVFVHGIER